jgi:hypothetical protein
MDGSHRKKKQKGFQDISHYFLSAAEAEVSGNAVGAAGHPVHNIPPMLSDDSKSGAQRPRQPMRRKENCAACAQLIARAGQPFQCRIYSVDYSRYKVPQQETIELNQGQTCPYFMRVTSRQIEDILRSHGSKLRPDHVREYAHEVEERLTHEKTVTVKAYGGMTAEEALREELLRYLVDGYSIVDATVALTEDASDENQQRSKTSRVRLRVQPES